MILYNAQKFKRRYFMKRILTLVLALLVVLIITPMVFATGDKEEKDEKVKLVYLSKWNIGEVTQEIINDAINEYMADNPNVTIEPVWGGREVNVKLMALIQGGDPPDFYDEDPEIIENSLGKDGLALDLTPYLKREKGWNDDRLVIDQFSDGFFEPITYGGEIHCLPIQQYLTVFWYNKTMFNELGIRGTPDTWPEFLNLCETLKGKGVPPIVMDGGIDFYNLYYFSHLADRIEGMNALLDAIYDKSGKSWDKPGFLEAARKVRELRDKGYFIKGFEGYQFPAGQIDWAQGKGALLLIHTYMPIEVADAVPDDFVFGSFPFPSVPGGKGSQYDITSIVGGVAILKSTKEPDIAFDFLKRLVSVKVQSRFAEEAKNVPVITGVPLPDIFSDLAEIMEKQTGTFKDYSGGPGQFEPEFAQSIMYPLNDQLIFGKISPEEFIKQVKEKAIAYWESR
jgi:raffinose/stachyose/melibiose transport system substrate-binding protein